MIASEVVTNALRVEVDRRGEKVLCAMVKVSRKQTPEEVVRKTINALNNAASFKLSWFSGNWTNQPFSLRWFSY